MKACAVIFLFFSIFSVVKAQKLSARAAQSDLEYLFGHLEEVHPNLYSYTAKEVIEKVVRKVSHEISDSISKFDFAKKVIPIVSALNEGHTEAAIPTDLLTAFLSKGGTLFPYTVSIRNGHGYILQSSESDVVPGNVLERINNHSVDSLILEMRKYTSGERMAFRDAVISRRFHLLIWLLLPTSNHFEIQVDGKLIRHPGISRDELNILRGRQSKALPFEYEEISSGVGLITFRSMSSRKQFKAFLRRTFATVENTSTTSLLIDVRNNGGGNSSLANDLFSYFYTGKFKIVDQVQIKPSRTQKKSFRKDYVKWFMYPFIPIAVIHPAVRPIFFGRNGKLHTINLRAKKMKVQPTLFKGDVYLLTSSYTFSSATLLANAFKCNKMGTIVGEETGGLATTYGDVVNFQLPNSRLFIQVSFKKFIAPCSDNNSERLGVIPDIETPAENALERTLSLINKSN